MDQRIPLDLAKEPRDALRALEKYIAQTSLPRSIVELVKLRVSMINGCAFCVDMHWRSLRDAGEPEARLYGLNAWHEQQGYTERERAALAWAECVTAVATTHVPDVAFEAVSEHFSTAEIADLTYVVVAINSWNRLCVAFRVQPPRISTKLDD
jgi:AhpD family alkylhydroperoxidase